MRFVHVIPERKTGGVEITVSSLIKKSNFVELFLIRSEQGWLRGYFVTLFNLRSVDVAVYSLWKSVPLLILSRLLFPKQRVGFFLHSQRDAHCVDWLMTRMALLLAHCVMVDSVSALSRSKLSNRKPCTVVNMLEVNKLGAPQSDLLKKSQALDECLRFIFWGRLHKDKQIDQQVKIIAELNKNCECSFDIIGPDEGELNLLVDLTASLGVSDNVTFHGEKTFDEIVSLARTKHFFFSTSKREGKALAVLEAMSMGLVPVAVPVGEISNYCQDGENSIFVSNNPSDAAEALLRALKNKDFKNLSVAARKSFAKECEAGCSYNEAITQIL